MVNQLSAESKLMVMKACSQFFDGLHKADLHDHPEVFIILDDYVKTQGYFIECIQRGVFGTKLQFVRIHEDDLKHMEGNNVHSR